MRTNGRYLCIRCPWEHLHTTVSSDHTATVWFLAGSGGIQHSAFSCRHAHCADRTTWEFLKEIGYEEATKTDGFEVIGPPVERAGGTPGDALSRQAVVTMGPEDERAVVVNRPTRHLTPTEAQREADARRKGLGRQPTVADPTHEGLPSLATHSPDLGHGIHRPRALESPGDLRTGQADVLTALGAGDTPKTLVVTEGTAHPLDAPLFERDKKSNHVKLLTDNFVLALERPDLVGAVIGRDEFTDDLLYRPWPLHQPFRSSPDTWTTGQARPFKDTDYVALSRALRKLTFGPSDIPIDPLRRCVAYVGDQRTFDSAIHWLTNLPAWDGIERIDTFCSAYLGSEDTPYTRAVGRYWWSAHAGRVLTPGCQADMAIVLISGQGTGKTSALRAMAPLIHQYVELNLAHRDEDLCRAMKGKIIGELAELRGLSTGRDMESVKAWVSRRVEEWVPKYLEFTRSFPRRLILVGTSNNDEFLADETGNRRWLPLTLPVDRQKVDAITRDKEQLWAEAADLYLSYGVLWSEAEHLARFVHAEHMLADPWEDPIRQWLVADDGFSGGRPVDREYLVMHDILRGAVNLTSSQITMALQFRAGRVMHKLGYERIVKWIEGMCHKVWVMQKKT